MGIPSGVQNFKQSPFRQRNCDPAKRQLDFPISTKSSQGIELERFFNKGNKTAVSLGDHRSLAFTPAHSLKSTSLEFSS